MAVKVHFGVMYKPHELNYEVVIGDLQFRTTRRNLERFVKDLRRRSRCVLAGNPAFAEERLIIEEGTGILQRKRMADYIELVLERVCKRHEGISG